MMKVDPNTISQPMAEIAWMAMAAAPSTCQTTPGIGRHCQARRHSSRLVTNTKVLRSTCSGMMVVHQRLKADRAMIVCWMAKSASRPRLTATAIPMGPGTPESRVLGTPKPPMKPIR